MSYGPKLCHDRSELLIKVGYAEPEQFGTESVTARSLPTLHFQADVPYFVDRGQSSKVPYDLGRFCLGTMFSFEF